MSNKNDEVVGKFINARQRWQDKRDAYAKARADALQAQTEYQHALEAMRAELRYADDELDQPGCAP